MPETYLNPTPEQFGAVAKMDHEGPLVMINLLKFAPDGGAEAYQKYGEAAAPFLANAEAKLRYIGDVGSVVIGPNEPDWDEIVLVEYPNKQAFLDMVTAEGYPSDLRTEAIIDSRLIVSTARTS